MSEPPKEGPQISAELDEVIMDDLKCPHCGGVVKFGIATISGAEAPSYVIAHVLPMCKPFVETPGDTMAIKVLKHNGFNFAAQA